MRLEITFAAATLAISGLASAGETLPPVKYYRCIDPGSCQCLAFSDTDKMECDECKKWKETVAGFLGGAKYAYGEGRAPRANVFLNDAAVELYGRELPKTTSGLTARLNDFYANPEEYGWTVVEGEKPPSGALALWPSNAGVVVGTSDKGQPEVLYPSAKKQGELAVTEAPHLGSAAKFVVPTPARKE